MEGGLVRHSSALDEEEGGQMCSLAAGERIDGADGVSEVGVVVQGDRNGPSPLHLRMGCTRACAEAGSRVVSDAHDLLWLLGCSDGDFLPRPQCRKRWANKGRARLTRPISVEVPDGASTTTGECTSPPKAPPSLACLNFPLSLTMIV